MHFNNPIPRSGMPQFSEQSSQQSLRESGSTGHLWKKQAKTTAQESANTKALHELKRKVEKMRRRVVGAAYSTPASTSNGGLRQCQITGLYGGNTSSNSNSAANYFQVKPFNNVTLSNSAFYVAKSIPSRMPNAATIYGQSFTYTYSDDNTRTSNNGTNSESQVMTQPFSINMVVHISPVDYSGANAPNNGGDIKYIEVNTEREWTCPF